MGPTISEPQQAESLNGNNRKSSLLNAKKLVPHKFVTEFPKQADVPECFARQIKDNIFYGFATQLPNREIEG